MRAIETVRAAAAAGTYLIAVASLPALAQDVARDAAEGKRLASQWCVSCHVIDREGTGTARDVAPSFPNVATNPAKSPEFLRVWLTRPHAPMPALSLSRREIEHLIAYIESLKK